MGRSRGLLERKAGDELGSLSQKLWGSGCREDVEPTCIPAGVCAAACVSVAI